MLYNVIIDDKTVEEIEIPEGISKRSFREGVLRFYKRKFGGNLDYLKIDRMTKSNSYLIMGKKGKLLFAMEEKKLTLIDKVINILTMDVKDLFRV